MKSCGGSVGHASVGRTPVSFGRYDPSNRRHKASQPRRSRNRCNREKAVVPPVQPMAAYGGTEPSRLFTRMSAFGCGYGLLNDRHRAQSRRSRRACVSRLRVKRPHFLDRSRTAKRLFYYRVARLLDGITVSIGHVCARMTPLCGAALGSGRFAWQDRVPHPPDAVTAPVRWPRQLSELQLQC